MASVETVRDSGVPGDASQDARRVDARLRGRKEMRRILLAMSGGMLILFCLVNFARVASAKGWRAGVARVEITPEDTLWLAGYADRTHAATGTLTKLWVKALVLEDSLGHRGVLIASDLIGYPRAISDTIRNRLARRFELSRAQVLLNSSHTHTGPAIRGRWNYIYHLHPVHVQAIDRYTDALEDKVVKVVGEALEDLRPVVLRAGNGVVRFQVNRRNNGKLFPLDLQAELAGPNQHDVPVLEVRSPGGALRALAFGYACHGTVLNTYKWSGDYPGFAQLALEKDFPEATALFFQGCAGDQNPLPRRSVPLARQYGRELAVAVERVLEEPLRTLKPILRMAYREIPLALDPAPSKAELKRFLAKAEGWQKDWAARMLERLEAGAEMPREYPYPVQVWRLGDQLLVALGGEPVIDYALEIKRVFGQQTFVFGYTNDVMAYIPSTRVLREGGYEGATSQMVYDLPNTWRADVEWRIMGAVLELAREVGASPQVEGVMETAP